MPTLTTPPLPPGPPPSSAGVACRCGSTQFVTTLQRFKDGTEHVRLDCARCKKFIRYAPRKGTPATPAFEHQPRPADAHPAELAPPPESWRWVGYVRPDGGQWYAIAETATLSGCWDALFSSHLVGDRLCVPVRPHHQRDTSEG